MTFSVLAGQGDAASSSERSTAAGQVTDADGSGFEADRRRILELIEAHDDIALRSCRPGHLTGSAFVVDPERMAGLVLFHTKLERWLQPGGHADGDTNLANVAWREAVEETGIDGLRVVVPAIDIDIHEVAPPGEDPHLHLDVRFLVLAPPGSEPVGNHESQGFRWVTAADMDRSEFDPGTMRLAQAAFAAAATLGPRGH